MPDATKATHKIAGVAIQLLQFMSQKVDGACAVFFFQVIFGQLGRWASRASAFPFEKRHLSVMPTGTFGNYPLTPEPFKSVIYDFFPHPQPI